MEERKERKRKINKNGKRIAILSATGLDKDSMWRTDSNWHLRDTRDRIKANHAIQLRYLNARQDYVHGYPLSVFGSLSGIRTYFWEYLIGVTPRELYPWHWSPIIFIKYYLLNNSSPSARRPGQSRCQSPADPEVEANDHSNGFPRQVTLFWPEWIWE